MRIDAMNQVSQLYSSKATKKTGQAGGLSFSDSLEISRVGRDMQVAKAAVAAAPDVREDRVAAIKAALANGTYSVSDEDLANKLLESFDI
ncbi:MAG: flagellar biosynthesis anti-sigma factor FlgM [Lachnospiraceae bacterium]|jgi:negative regulator of flagellin synthesis FlgM|nr:flagellar biosynthesis anti-sigma factor FlgM [Lachnospiraceae bacterium]MBQ6090033.1 flagellar biosynthesis anti-sigma factor FlgM [Lachnospiraceae bacterium]MBR5368948.1 flagellar biosynthesis anti-sigma factor FlgM [Lachnospiraceae bacterium]